MVHVYEGMGLHGDGGMGHYGDWVWDTMGTGYGTLWGLGMGLHGNTHNSQSTKIKSFVAAITSSTLT